MPPPSSNSRALPPPPTAAASALSADAEKNVVVLRDWSFGELKQTQTNSNHLGFCAVGTLVYHPRTNPMSFGLEFHSSEIRGIHSNGIVVSRNMSLYRLEGPADPARYNAQARLAAIMQPLCRSTWPSNAQALFEQVSKFFRSDKQDSVGLGFQNPPTAGGAAPKPTPPLAPSPPSEPEATPPEALPGGMGKPKPPASPGWVTRSDAWARVEIKPADRLPRCPGSNLPVNHLCDHCREDQLCPEHRKLLTIDFDFTELHMQAMNASEYCLVECGGGGDCFYHSMLFLARLHNVRHLVTKWKDHKSFRETTCEQLRNPTGQPRFNFDPRTKESASFMEMINRKPKGSVKPQSDSVILRYYIASHKKSKTPKCSGTYVLEEIVQAVAFQNDITIVVADRTTPRYHVVMPTGGYADIDDATAVDTPFFLWCTGGHYQAFVKIDQFEILSTAFERTAFKESCLLYAKDFCLQ